MSTTTAPNSEKDKATGQSQLTRYVEASLKIAFPDPSEIRFRTSLLACAASEFPDLKTSYITRMYEAACEVKYPSDEVTEFRQALQVVIAKSLNLRAHRKPQSRNATPV